MAALWQLSVILCLDQVYEVGRALIPRHPDRAMHNAARVIHWESRLKIFHESSIQHFWLSPHSVGWLQIPPRLIINAVNLYYLYGHFLGTAVFLTWLYLFRRTAFVFVRDVLFASTGMALIIYILFPLAPPRLVPRQGFTDVLAVWLKSHVQGVQAAFNPYAAMPSLHFVWALIVGATLAIVGRHIVLRVLGPVYTALMLATIVISANHFILDAVGSVVVVAVATTGVWLVTSLASGRLQPDQPWRARLPSPL
ncbi:MAG: hypothetical protein NVSMB65_05170 [Chloroflexota bacterium]